MTLKREEIVAFAAMRLSEAQEGEGVIFGVAPEAQGKGLFRAFLTEPMAWSAAQGASRMVISTHPENYAVQRARARLGFHHFR